MKYTEKVDKAMNMIQGARNKYPNTKIACSFGKDSMVILHMGLRIDSQFPIFSVMTPFKFKETLAYKKHMEKIWDLNIKTYINTVVPMDFHEYETDPDECCRIYKVEQTKLAVHDLDAWITGLRRTEGRTRTDYQYIEEKGGLVKINPILDFTELDVWRYLSTNYILVNPLYRQGYRSLGCMPCTRKEDDETEMEREGRWANTSKCGGECGIHTQVSGMNMFIIHLTPS